MRIELQVIGASLRSIADEMGAALVRSAFSANIKERRDCSTALFDARGRMVAQAEHIPVHLGALPDAVAAVQAHDPAPGEAWILNDPFAGGTHLPDITLVTCTRTGFAVTRAHHADVGAAEPGSLPADSRRLEEEGVVIPPTRLDDDILDELVSQMRNPDERRGDLRAQLAAHGLAERRVDELCERRGQETVEAAMDELHDYSERLVRTAIARLPDGRFEAADVLEPAGGGELELHAAVTVDGDELEIDFAGTAAQHDGNLNCPLAVTRSACYFVVRCLTDPDVPASGGAFVPVPAQGQGTMNNLTLGNDRVSYYETVGGGQGACPDAEGPSGVHVAMSNTLSTPTEALELAYPVRVERHELRLGSGGAGEHRGGDGVVRELRVLEDCRLSLVGERRTRAPQGARGGEPGLPGRNRLNGEQLPAKVTRGLRAGDVVRVETPGGGGYGPVQNRQ